jgi:hypothetical protein
MPRSRERVERFVLCARRVNKHSLVREHRQLIEELTSGTIWVPVLTDMRTGEAEHRVLLELPPEELFESFAARIRAFIMRKKAVCDHARLGVALLIRQLELPFTLPDGFGALRLWACACRGR